MILLRVVNEEWMEGRVGHQEGMFPVNFVDIKVPLSGAPTNIVNALYTFEGEIWEDLPFKVYFIISNIFTRKTLLSMWCQLS